MHSHVFFCPHCTARLRSQDRKLVGIPFACPDCHRQLQLEQDRQGTLSAVAVMEGLPVPGPSKLHQPTTFAVGATGAVALGAFAWHFWSPPAPVKTVQKPPILVDQANQAQKPVDQQLVAEKKKVDTAVQSDATRPSSDRIPVAAENEGHKEAVEPPTVVAPVAKLESPNLPDLKPLPAMEELARLLPQQAVVPPRDLRAALNLRVEKFSQTRPVTWKTLIRQVEEMAGAPIDITGVPETVLSQQVTLELRETTLERVLEELLRRPELVYECESTRIKVLPKRKAQAE